ncbi:hypothetical protein ACFL52_00055 [Candidatus Margulisiibacteriota bacterium]
MDAKLIGSSLRAGIQLSIPDPFEHLRPALEKVLGFEQASIISGKNNPLIKEWVADCIFDMAHCGLDFYYQTLNNTVYNLILFSLAAKARYQACHNKKKAKRVSSFINKFRSSRRCNHLLADKIKRLVKVNDNTLQKIVVDYYTDHASSIAQSIHQKNLGIKMIQSIFFELFKGYLLSGNYQSLSLFAIAYSNIFKDLSEIEGLTSTVEAILHEKNHAEVSQEESEYAIKLQLEWQARADILKLFANKMNFVY